MPLGLRFDSFGSFCDVIGSDQHRCRGRTSSSTSFASKDDLPAAVAAVRKDVKSAQDWLKEIKGLVPVHDPGEKDKLHALKLVVNRTMLREFNTLEDALEQQALAIQKITANLREVNQIGRSKPETPANKVNTEDVFSMGLPFQD
mmetsp:Transcript_18813/g.47033  ORF Transcript_18813/g.47033 Transcript_18813/m.47033 type:complete len:145 (-) Transcript_18813:277-711(-)